MTVTLESACISIVDCEHKTSPIDESGEFFAVGTPAMRGNIINYGESRRISQETFTTWTRRLTPKFGDLLFAREAPVGPVVRIPRSENVAPGQRTVLIRPNLDVVDPRYLYYLLASPLQQSRIASTSSGSTVAHLNVADVRSFELPQLPGLPEQRAIAEVLGSLDDKIAANTKLATIVDDLLAGKFAWLTSASSSAPLGTIARVNVASTKPSVGGSLRYLDIAAVGVGEYQMPEVISWDDAPGRARRVITTGDTVWSTVRPTRRSHALVLDDDPLLIGSTGLAVLTSRNGQFAFLHEATRTERFTSYLESAAEGSAYPAVRADRFLDAPVPEMDPADREAFEKEAAPLRRRVHSASVESRRLAAARDALLPLLMSGKIRVKDAEGVVEGVV